MKTDGSSYAVAAINQVFLIVGCVLFLLSFIIHHAWFLVGLIWLVFLFSAFWGGRDGSFSDPRVFFVGFFCMYHTWFEIGYLLGAEQRLFVIDADAIVSSLRYSLFSLLVFVNIFNFFINSSSSYGALVSAVDSRPWFRSSERLVFSLLVSIVMVLTVYILLRGGGSKSAIASEVGGVKLIGNVSFIILTILVMLVLSRLPGNRILVNKVFLGFASICLLYVLVAGERDVLFRLLIAAIVIFYEKNRSLNFFKICLIIFLAAFIVPISQFFKAVFVAEDFYVSLSWIDFFSNEFSAASRNLYTLLHFGVSHDWRFVVSDIVRAIVPSFLFGEDGFYSSTKWFNQVFRVSNDFSGSSGWGFGLVAQGYLLGGYAGVAFVSAFVAFITCYFHNRKNKSEYYFVFYVYLITVLVYVMRADLSNFISQSFKIGGFSLLVLWMSSRLMKSHR